MRETIHTIVFQEREGGGNPCPVTLEADGMTEEEMRDLSARTGEESAFLQRSTRADCALRARYFVPNGELGLCVHATIGAVSVLVRRGLLTASPISLETGLGPVRVEGAWREGELEVSVDQFAPAFGPEIRETEEIGRALGIGPDDLAPLPVRSASTSRSKLMIPLTSRAVLDGLRPEFEELWSLCDRYGVSGFYPFVLERAEAGEAVCRARQFPNRSGYLEDPATGVAASALSAYLIAGGLVPVREGWNRCTVYQGQAMGRPGVIGADCLVENGAITRTRVRGRALVEDCAR